MAMLNGYPTVTISGVTLSGGGGYGGSGTAGTHYGANGVGFTIVPATMSMTYDDSGGTMEIGGTVCHLCGARTVETNVSTYEVGKKKRNRRMSTTRYVEYACGTYVTKIEGREPVVGVGSKCIKLNGN